MGARHRAADRLYERKTSAVGPARKACHPTRRLLAIAAVLDGVSRESGGEGRRYGSPDAAGLGDKVQGPEGIISKPSPGAPGKLSAEHKALLAQIVEAGPIPGVVR
jgi:hypothetical protein